MAVLVCAREAVFRFLKQGLVRPTASQLIGVGLRHTSGKSTRVQQVSLIQDLKENNSKCEEAMLGGTFMAFHRGHPLVRVNESNDGRIKYGVQYLQLPELLPHFNNSHETVIQNSALLSLTSDLIAQSAILIPSKPESLSANVETASGGKFVDLRVAFFGLSEMDVTVVSQGSALLHWNRNFAFCSRCGHKMTKNTAGSQKICSSCKHVQYTTLSPVIIVLVSNAEKNKCLLVRQPNHVKGMFTAIAGYVEIGETLEEAVTREIAEEVGLDIQHQEYIMSQHWPLPMSSLMLGCLATANSSSELTIDKRELQDARWFSIPEVQSAVNNIENNPFLRISPSKGSTIFVPPKGAIAYDLVKLWLRKVSAN